MAQLVDGHAAERKPVTPAEGLEPFAGLDHLGRGACRFRTHHVFEQRGGDHLNSAALGSGLTGELGVDLGPDVEGEGHASTLRRPWFLGQAIVAANNFAGNVLAQRATLTIGQANNVRIVLR